MIPKLKFKNSKTLDKKYIYDFLDPELHAGVDFRKTVLTVFPGIKQTRKSVSEHVIKHYAKNKKKIEKNTELIEKEWRKHEDYFFKTVADWFKYPWQRGKYIAYVSIDPINPRFLWNKSFTVFYRSPRANAIIAHELLHFMFYEYIHEYFRGEMSEEKMWHLSEIVNVVIMKDKRIRHIYPHPSKGYDDHLKYIPRFKKIFKESKTMREFISKSITEINKIKELN